MPFTGNENHKIELADAAKLTRNYREAAGTGALLAAFFGKNALQAILNQAGCVGLRIYNARAENGNPNFVLVGVNSQGDDLTGGEIAEFGIGCPPICSTPNELTS